MMQYNDLNFSVRNCFGVVGRTQVMRDGELHFVLDPYLCLSDKTDQVDVDSWPTHYPAQFDLIYVADDTLHLVYARFYMSAAGDVQLRVNPNAVLPVGGEFMHFRVQPTLQK